VDDEEPTRPGQPKPEQRWETIDRMLLNLLPAERRDFVLMADNWYQCDAEGRALGGAVIAKMVPR